MMLASWPRHPVALRNLGHQYKREVGARGCAVALILGVRLRNGTRIVENQTIPWRQPGTAAISTTILRFPGPNSCANYRNV